jgi:hypothetical protein
MGLSERVEVSGSGAREWTAPGRPAAVGFNGSRDRWDSESGAFSVGKVIESGSAFGNVVVSGMGDRKS